MRRISLTLILLLTAWIITSCADQLEPRQQISDPWGVVDIARGSTIRIAAATSISAVGVSTEGLEQLRGIELAVQDYGRIKGFSVEIVVADTGCSREGGTNTAAALVDTPDLAAIIGHTCSESCAGAAGLYNLSHVTMVSPSCSASSLTDPLLHTDIFARTIYDDAYEGRAAAQFAYYELAARQAVLISDGTLETTALLDAFSTIFEELGGTVIRTDLLLAGESRIGEIVAGLAADRPDVIYAPLLPKDAATLTRLRELAGLDQVPLIGGRYYLNTWYLERAEAASEGVYAVGPLTAGEGIDYLYERYADRYGEEPDGVTIAPAYDAAQMVLAAIERTAVVSPSGSLQIGKKALHDALFATSQHPGLTGSLTCTAWGDCGASGLAVQRVQAGRWNTIYVSGQSN